MSTTVLIRMATKVTYEVKESTSTFCEDNLLTYYHSQLSANNLAIRVLEPNIENLISSHITGVKCPEPDTPDNVVMDPKSYYYEDVKSYECILGHVIRAGSASRTCQDNGTFTGERPQCESE